MATPVAMRAAQDHRLRAGRLAVAVAVTANATSFLLPTSNVTNLLLLDRTPLPVLDYLRGSWLAWLLVVVTTIGPLTSRLARARTAGTGPAGATSAGPSARAALDLTPMFLIASASAPAAALRPASHRVRSGSLRPPAQAASRAGRTVSGAIRPAQSVGALLVGLGAAEHVASRLVTA